VQFLPIPRDAQALRAQEKAATAALSFRCGRCGTRFDSLDAVRHGFACPERMCVGEPDATLTEEALDASLIRAGDLRAKVDTQLGSDEILGRVGILEILDRLAGAERCTCAFLDARFLDKVRDINPFGPGCLDERKRRPF